MHFFEGVALAFRNPRAHGLDEDTAEDAGFDRHNQPAGEESRQGNAPRALSYGTDLPGTRGWFPSPTRTAMPSARLSSNGE